MSELSTHHRTPAILALMSLLALLLVIGGCSKQESSAPESSGVTEEVMEPAPETAMVDLTEPAEAPDAMPAETPEPAAMAEEAATTAAAPAADGEGIYNKSCKVCHAAGVANAPKLGDGAAWAPRIAKGEDALFESIKNGLKAMPPKGTCMTCSDEELKSALQYMLSQAG